MVGRARTKQSPSSVVARSVGLLGVVGVAASAAMAPVATAAGPPPGRAYELVSPADDPSAAIAGVSTEAYPMPGRASSDGDRLIYGAGSVIGSNWSGPANPMIFGQRTDKGWTARTAVRSLDQGDTPTELTIHEVRGGWLTDAGDELVFGMRPLQSITDWLGAGTALAFYRSLDADVAPEWLSAPNAGMQPAYGLGGIATTAEDTKTVVVTSSAPLTADAPAMGTAAVYARRRGGDWQLISRLPDNSLPAAGAQLANGGPITDPHNAGNAPAVSMRNQVTADGRFVLFRAGASVTSAALYVRDLDNNVTHQLSGGGSGAPTNAVSLGTNWGAAGQANISVPTYTVVAGLVSAARDGKYAYFNARPNTTAAAVLYQADLASGVVTPQPELNGPPLGLSPDGRRVIFLRPPPGGTNVGNWTLRYWDMDNPGTSVLIGTIPATGTNMPSGKAIGLARVYRSLESGTSWVFTAMGNLDPARPSNAPAATQQLYRWAVGDSAPTCLSCVSTDNVARTSGVNLNEQEGLLTERFTAPTASILAVTTNYNKTKLAQPGRSISDDGRWLLFDSPDRLVSEDTNDVRDVYLWDRDADPAEQLQLVSSGVGPSPSYAIDLDPSGRTAFFSTRDGLVPADDDGAYDVYAARIGGGFPEAPDDSCVAEGCREPVLTPPADDPIVSNRLVPVPQGPQQAAQPGSPKLRVRAVRTTSRWLKLRVDTPKAGRIRVSGARVRTTTRTAKRAATYTVQVPLNATAQRLVARGRTVKVSLRVQFTPSGAKKSSQASTSVSIKKGR